MDCPLCGHALERHSGFYACPGCQNNFTRDQCVSCGEWFTRCTTWKNPRGELVGWHNHHCTRPAQVPPNNLPAAELRWEISCAICGRGIDPEEGKELELPLGERGGLRRVCRDCWPQGDD